MPARALGGRNFLVVDEPALRNVAQKTGGAYFAATDADGLTKVLADLPKHVTVSEQDIDLSAAFGLLAAARPADGPGALDRSSPSPLSRPVGPAATQASMASSTVSVTLCFGTKPSRSRALSIENIGARPMCSSVSVGLLRVQPGGELRPRHELEPGLVAEVPRDELGVAAQGQRLRADAVEALARLRRRAARGTPGAGPRRPRRARDGWSRRRGRAAGTSRPRAGTR